MRFAHIRYMCTLCSAMWWWILTQSFQWRCPKKTIFSPARSCRWEQSVPMSCWIQNADTKCLAASRCRVAFFCFWSGSLSWDVGDVLPFSWIFMWNQWPENPGNKDKTSAWDSQHWGFPSFYRLPSQRRHPAVASSHVNFWAKFHDWLVVWNHLFLCFHILGIVTPSDEFHHFSEGWRKTTNIHDIQDDFEDPHSKIHRKWSWKTHRRRGSHPHRQILESFTLRGAVEGVVKAVEAAGLRSA